MMDVDWSQLAAYNYRENDGGRPGTAPLDSGRSSPRRSPRLPAKPFRPAPRQFRLPVDPPSFDDSGPLFGWAAGSTATRVEPMVFNGPGRATPPSRPQRGTNRRATPRFYPAGEARQAQGKMGVHSAAAGPMEVTTARW